MSEYQEGTIKRGKLSVIVMPNDEILCAGKHIGWLNERAPSWLDKDRRLGYYIEEEEE